MALIATIWEASNVDESERAETHIYKLERSNGGVGGNCAKTANTGARPVVETAQNSPQVDCKMQHKLDQWISRETLRLKRTRCANVPQRTMWQVTAVEMEASPVERPRRQMARSGPRSDGRNTLRAASEQKREMAMLGTSKNLRDGWVSSAVESFHQDWRRRLACRMRRQVRPTESLEPVRVQEHPVVGFLRGGQEKVEILVTTIIAMGCV